MFTKCQYLISIKTLYSLSIKEKKYLINIKFYYLLSIQLFKYFISTLNKYLHVFFQHTLYSISANIKYLLSTLTNIVMMVIRMVIKMVMMKVMKVMIPFFFYLLYPTNYLLD